MQQRNLGVLEEFVSGQNPKEAWEMAFSLNLDLKTWWNALFSLSLIFIYTIHQNLLLPAIRCHYPPSSTSQPSTIQAIFTECIINTNVPRHSFSHLIIINNQ